MEKHTTNYINTFIGIAEDCPASAGEIPPQKGDGGTVASMLFELISNNPYAYTSDDVLFQVHAQRNHLEEHQLQKAREVYFSKGQPCLRSSPLTKRYGWGIHANEEGKIALYGVETEEYRKLAADKKLKAVKAMRSKKR